MQEYKITLCTQVFLSVDIYFVEAFCIDSEFHLGLH